MKGMHAQGGLPIPGIVHIDQPYHFGEGEGMSAHEFGLARARQLEEKILALGWTRWPPSSASLSRVRGSSFPRELLA